MLTAHGPVPVTTQVTKTVQVRDCHMSGDPPRFSCTEGTRTIQQNQTTQQLLTAANIRIVKNTGLLFGAITQTTLPDQIAAASLDACNPTPTTGQQSASFSQQIQHSESATVTHTVTNTLSDSIGGSLSLSKVLKISDTLQIGMSDSTATASLTGTALTQQLQVSVSEQIPAQSRYALEFLITPTQFTAPFSATVTIDADLSKNDKNLSLLSDIADEASRTFVVDGTVMSVVGLTAHSNFEQLPYDPQHCPPGSAITATPLHIEPEQQFGVSQIAVKSLSKKKR